MTAPDGAGDSAAVVTVRVLQPVRANKPRTYRPTYVRSERRRPPTYYSAAHTDSGVAKNLRGAGVQWCGKRAVERRSGKYFGAGTALRQISLAAGGTLTLEAFSERERKCADTIGTVLVLWAGRFQC